MSAIYAEAIERAAKSLEVGQEMEWEFSSAKEAHVEYMKFSREMKKKNNNPAVRALTLSRRGCCVVLIMERPEYLFPEPRIVSKERVVVCGSSYANLTEKERIKQMMMNDLAEGLMSQEEYDEQIKSLE